VIKLRYIQYAVVGFGVLVALAVSTAARAADPTGSGGAGPRQDGRMQPATSTASACLARTSTSW